MTSLKSWLDDGRIVIAALVPGGADGKIIWHQQIGASSQAAMFSTVKKVKTVKKATRQHVERQLGFLEPSRPLHL